MCPYILDARLRLWVSLEHAFTCVFTTSQAERRSSTAHLQARWGAREDYSPAVTCTGRQHDVSSQAKYRVILLSVTPKLHRSVPHCVGNIASRDTSPLLVCHGLVSATKTAPDFNGNVFTLGARALANCVYIRALGTHLPLEWRRRRSTVDLRRVAAEITCRFFRNV